jgi:hypothetical protein
VQQQTALLGLLVRVASSGWIAHGQERQMPLSCKAVEQQRLLAFAAVAMAASLNAISPCCCQQVKNTHSAALD